ncbi:MAG: response regulator transcription factor [Anaerolineales bacterium]|nr:response regulator transcription factor [Anaerolineales bacterium]
MTVKRVFVLSRRSMFHKGIETLLSQEEGVEIVGHDTEPEVALESIERFSPDVVIVNLDDPEPVLSQTVLCILREKQDISIIWLSLQDNCIRIYRGESKQVHQLEDLLNVIQN